MSQAQLITKQPQLCLAISQMVKKPARVLLKKATKRMLGKKTSLYSDCSQTRRRSLTSSGIDIFILLEPSDSCLHSHFILHATTKRRGKKTELIKCAGLGEGMGDERVREAEG